MMSKIYSLLDHPAVHNTVQKILSAGRSDLMPEAIRHLFHPAPDQWVLDMGCGPGRYAELFSCRYAGVDLSRAFLEFAVKNKAVSRFHFFIQADVKDIIFREQSLDYVLCAGVLHHLPEALAKTLLLNFKKIIKPGGKIYIIEPIYPQNRWNILGSLLFAFDRGQFTRTKSQLDPLMAGQGFKDASYQIPAERSFPQEVRIYEFTA